MSGIDNYSWLNSITPIDKRHWHSEPVLRIFDHLNFRFYYQCHSDFRGKISTSDIKGIYYAWEYNCIHDITWIELLNNLKRFDDIRRSFHSHSELVDHANNDYDESRLVLKIGEVYYTRKGQHRITLAKFLGINTIEVDIVEYKLDQNKFHRYINRQKQLSFFKDSGFEISTLDEDGELNFISVVLGDYHITIWEPDIDDFINKYKRLIHFGVLNKLLAKVDLFVNQRRFYQVKNGFGFSDIRNLLRNHKYNRC